MRPDPAIEFTEVSKAYGRRLALDNASFQVAAGTAFGFLGPNGAGKTTAIAILLGLVRPTRGSVRVFGQSLGEAQGMRIGSIVERPNFFPHLSAVANLRVVSAARMADPPAIERALTVAGLWERRNDPFRSYSIGMKQRLAIAAALLGEPDVLVLDEPLNGLDPTGIRDVRNLISGLRDARKTVFLSSHVLSEVAITCDAVAVIHKGRIVFTGPTERLTKSAAVEVELGGDNLGKTLTLARSYPGAESVRVEKSLVVLSVQDPDPSHINEFFCRRGVYLGRLAVRDADLEAAFIRLTEAEDAS